MSLAALLRVLMRRWVVALPATTLAVLAVAAVGRAMAPTHEATAVAVLLPGAADVTRQALEEEALEDDDIELRSPYLRVGTAEKRAADALIRSLDRGALSGDVEVDIEAEQPIVHVAARAASAAAAVAAAERAVDTISRHIAQRQQARDVPAELFLRLELVTLPAAERINEDRARAMTAVGALGLVGVIGLSLVAERFSVVSRRVRAVRATTGDRGPVVVLSVFAVVLVTVPQIHSLGPFAVTGPMVIGALGGALWAAARYVPAIGRPRRMPKVAIALMVFVGVALASYALAQLRPLDPVEARAADRFIAFLVMYGGITLLAAEGLRSKEQLRRLLAVIVVVAAAQAVVGILQAFGNVDIPGLTRVHSPRGGFPRIAGTARHPIDFGVYCAAALPLALHFANFARVRRMQLAAAGAAAALIAGAALSVTRSALLGLVVGTVVLLAGRQGTRRWLVLGTAVVVVSLTPLVVPNFAETVGEMVGAAPESPSIQSRVADYEPVLDHLTRHPLLGRGAGTFEPSVHFVLDNNYLGLAIEMGALGLGAFLAVLWAAWSASRAVRHHDLSEPPTRDLAQALAASIAVLAVAMGTYDLMAFQLGGGSLFLLLGVAGALERLVRSEVPAIEPVPVAARPAFATT